MGKEAPANYVPAAAVIRRVRALSGFIGVKDGRGMGGDKLSKRKVRRRTDINGA